MLGNSSSALEALAQPFTGPVPSSSLANWALSLLKVHGAEESISALGKIKNLGDFHV